MTTPDPDVIRHYLAGDAYTTNTEAFDAVNRLLAERDALASQLREAREREMRWVRLYEQSAPDDANPQDPGWALWQESRAVLSEPTPEEDGPEACSFSFQGRRCVMYAGHDGPHSGASIEGKWYAGTFVSHPLEEDGS